jgi:PKD repeat protein
VDAGMVIVTDSSNGGTPGNGRDNLNGDNTAPVAILKANTTLQKPNNPKLFNAAESWDEDGDTLTYHWNFGDENEVTTSESTIVYSYDAEKTYDVTLTVSDGKGGSDSATISVIISSAVYNNPPSAPTVTGINAGHVDTIYEFTIQSTDKDGDTIKYTINWDDGETGETIFLPSGTSTVETHMWNSPGKYLLKITASDNKTVSATKTYTVLIDVHLVSNIGYLIDENADGIYEKFKSDKTGTENQVEQQAGGTYLIDGDNDGKWDYSYDMSTKTLEDYNSSSSDTSTSNSIFLLLGFLVVIVIIIAMAAYWQKNKKSKSSKPSRKNKRNK